MRRLDLRKTQAARLNTIRDINRQIVLNYVREREPHLACGDWTGDGSATVNYFCHRGSFEDGRPGRRSWGRGVDRRPQAILAEIAIEGAIAIGFAITPTYTTVATSDLAGRVVEQEEFLTDPDANKTLNEVIAFVRPCVVTANGQRCVK